MPETRVLRPDPDGIAAAAAILRAGGLVAFPTETVYGLGANALDAEAVAGIFRAKGRPAEDPLIVHLASVAAIGRVAADVPERARRLADAFWPGPLTLVLPKTATVPPTVTAGLPTVGVRVPSHPVAQALLRAADLPISAPSANLFSHPSPTRAEHVLDDLRGRIDAVLDGGPTLVGVESTIVDVSSHPARLLRPGGVPLEAIEAVLGETLAGAPEPLASAQEALAPQVAPGLLETHYAPRTPLVLVDEPDPAWAQRCLLALVQEALSSGQRVGVLLLDEDRDRLPAGVASERVGAWRDPAASAERLFHALRTLDRAGLDVLFARHLADPTTGLGRALADRLTRAAARRA